MGWASSSRRSELPRDWAKRVERVKRRAHGRCQAETHEPGCDRVGRECDHVGDPHDHSLTNLQWLSKPCHRAKTQREARAARGVTPAPRTPERHPGAV